MGPVGKVLQWNNFREGKDEVGVDLNPTASFPFWAFNLIKISLFRLIP